MSQFFLPYQGEFGCYITTFVRVVHTWKSEPKIVACPVDHRCLFPTANAFFHDYAEFLPDRKKRGGSRRPWVSEQLQKLRSDICERYPGYRDTEFVMPFMKLNCFKTPEIIKSRFEPKITHQGLRADVVITPRYRKLVPNRNLPFWQQIVDQLTARGYSVGSVGSKDTSISLKRVAFNSWDYGGLEACIELLSNAKLVLAQNTGTAHLAVFLRCPIILMTTGHGMISWMETQRDQDVHFQLIDPDPNAAVIEALAFLDKSRTDSTLAPT